MCILITKPANKKFPSVTTMRRCMRSNPDGFGFCTPTRYYRTTDPDKFLRELYKLNEAEPCIIHCRYATHGSVKVQNCHPFKKNGVYFAHNGILPIKPIGDKTDSETAFIKFFLPALEEYGKDSKEFKATCEALIGSSKFAFLVDGDIITFGNFVKRQDPQDECMYSNLRFDYDISRYFIA